MWIIERKKWRKKGGKRECYELILVCGVNCEVNMDGVSING